MFLCPCLTFSKCLFALSAGPSPSACCESRRRASAVSRGGCSPQTCSEVPCVGRSVSSSRGNLPAVSGLGRWLSKDGRLFRRSDTCRCSETSWSGSGATRLGLGTTLPRDMICALCELLNFLLALTVSPALWKGSRKKPPEEQKVRNDAVKKSAQMQG